MDPPKRERKRQVNYAENDYYRNALKAQGGRAPGGPRLPKMPPLQDFQFFNLPRLTELYDQEQAYELFKHQQSQKEAAARQQVSLPADPTVPFSPFLPSHSWLQKNAFLRLSLQWLLGG